ncbi:MAG: tetratricopeptide repeat protein [Elusimicrobiota bacterium]|nr:MAG: tetratricopeptide repeat protein [Elusimicrobiota bacterium]
MKTILIATLVLFSCCLRAAAADLGAVRAMLRLARREADVAAKKTREADSRLLLEIAREQYLAGDPSGARDSLRAATIEISTAGPCPLVHFQAVAARAQWESGNIAEASATLKALAAAGQNAARIEKRECLLPLVELQVAFGDIDGAYATAEIIPGARKTKAYPQIAEALARQDRWDEAVSVISKAGPTEGDPAVYAIMRSRAAAGQWKEAAAVVSSIDADLDNFYSSIAVDAAKAGDVARGLEIMKKVRKPDEYAWAEIGQVLGRLGKFEEAIRLLSKNLARSPDRLAKELMVISDLQSRTGYPDEAKRTMKIAISVSAKGDPQAHAGRLLYADAVQERLDGPLLKAAPVEISWVVRELCHYGRCFTAIKLIRKKGIRGLDIVPTLDVVRELIRRGKSPRRRLGPRNWTGPIGESAKICYLISPASRLVEDSFPTPTTQYKRSRISNETEPCRRSLEPSRRGANSRPCPTGFIVSKSRISAPGRGLAPPSARAGRTDRQSFFEGTAARAQSNRESSPFFASSKCSRRQTLESTGRPPA